MRRGQGCPAPSPSSRCHHRPPGKVTACREAVVGANSVWTVSVARSRSPVWARVVVVALVPQQVQRDGGHPERQGQCDQAESVPGRAGDRSRKGEHQVGRGGELQREGGGGPGGDDAAFVPEGGQGVVDRVARAPAPRDGEVFGGRVAFEAERAFGERMAGPHGDNELIAADETWRMSGSVGRPELDSRSTSPRRSSGVSVPDSAGRRSCTPGAWRWTEVIRAVPQAAIRASCQRTVNTRSRAASSSSCCADRIASRCATAGRHRAVRPEQRLRVGRLGVGVH